MADIYYISSFLSKVEGSRQTRGYVPCHKKSGGTANYRGQGDPAGYTAMGASGVTIATGCDLGQTSVELLGSYNLAPSIIDDFSPYIGLKKSAALAALHAAPLTISEQAAEATDMAVHLGYLRRFVIPTYENDSGRIFAMLPKQAQAVIMSLIFQKGAGGVRREWPKTWKHLCSQDWEAAAHELLTGFTQYRERRRTEGRLLLEIGR